MSAKHTPGPWTVYAPHPSYVLAGDYLIGPWAGTGDAVREANARLIAAAPDLYEVCKEYLANFPEEPCDCLTCQRARAAVAKAEGREP